MSKKDLFDRHYDFEIMDEKSKQRMEKIQSELIKMEQPDYVPPPRTKIPHHREDPPKRRGPYKMGRPRKFEDDANCPDPEIDLPGYEKYLRHLAYMRRKEKLLKMRSEDGS